MANDIRGQVYFSKVVLLNSEFKFRKAKNFI